MTFICENICASEILVGSPVLLLYKTCTTTGKTLTAVGLCVCVDDHERYLALMSSNSALSCGFRLNSSGDGTTEPQSRCAEPPKQNARKVSSRRIACNFSFSTRIVCAMSPLFNEFRN